jgi:hypothetical protein
MRRCTERFIIVAANNSIFLAGAHNHQKKYPGKISIAHVINFKIVVQKHSLQNTKLMAHY